MRIPRHVQHDVKQEAWTSSGFDEKGARIDVENLTFSVFNKRLGFQGKGANWTSCPDRTIRRAADGIKRT